MSSKYSTDENFDPATVSPNPFNTHPSHKPLPKEQNYKQLNQTATLTYSARPFQQNRLDKFLRDHTHLPSPDDQRVQLGNTDSLKKNYHILISERGNSD